MPIDTTATAIGTGASTGTASASQNAMSQLGADYQSFLTLLTAQIQNQDPLAPMDSTAFVSQLATLTQVEQAVVQNANLESISAQLSSLSVMSGLGMIGRDVVAPGSDMTLAEGGEATVGYRLANAAETVRIDITSADGTVLRSYDALPTEIGTMHEISWDGLDYEGLPLPEGEYSVTLEALDAEGNNVTSQTYVVSSVTALSNVQGIAMLELANGQTVPAGTVQEVR